MAVSGKSSQGFTLLELLVALAILAFALTLLPPFLSAGRSASELREATRNIVNGLRETRSKAIAGNRELVFTLNVEERSYRVGEAGSAQALAGTINLELLTAQSEISGGGGGDIRFYPDGGSSGGEITVSRDGNTHLVTVDWLTGAVRLADQP